MDDPRGTHLTWRERAEKAEAERNELHAEIDEYRKENLALEAELARLHKCADGFTLRCKQCESEGGEEP